MCFYCISKSYGINRLSSFKGLPGKSSLQRGEEQRQFTGTWADKVEVSEVPQWGRQRFNRMGHRIKMKGVGAGPGKQPIPGEEESECRFCDGFL